jgi:alkylated DNA nucleotide flippase Atl1
VDAADRAEEVYRRIRSIPEGHVTTYGDLTPGAPRLAGQIMSQGHPSDIPWYRVVRADGSLTQGEPQRRKLEAEGVPFKGKRVDMDAAWAPVDAV